MTAALIVQARFKSTRLPGKVLRRIGARSVLGSVLERSQAVAGVDAVCCCVPDGPEDDPVAAEAVRSGSRVIRGPEHDVLARYLIGARELDADPIMRVTSDCPLVDPFLCAEVLAAYRSSEVDIASNDLLPSWPHGLGCEVFSRGWLERAAREAVDFRHREHVTTFIYDHPDARVLNLNGPGGDAARHRWVLDTAEDLAVIQAIATRLPDSPQGWRWTAALAVVEADPDLLSLSRERDLRQFSA
jgi:spore coat polysaccharide biosynthesis protein SpsF